MKHIFFGIVIAVFLPNASKAQEWMTSLPIAKKLALAQNKMLFMVWEEAALNPLPILVDDDNGNSVFIHDFIENLEINEILWEHFVPVIVSEDEYPELLNAIEGKRSSRYLSKFNDNSVKILDANGNILNLSDYTQSYFNLTQCITDYALNTVYLKQELTNYANEKNFYTAFYLASAYTDFAIYVPKKIRSDVISLSTLYLQEAYRYLETYAMEDKSDHYQRCELLEINQFLLLDKPRKTLRRLKKINETEISRVNSEWVNYLYFVAYSMLNDEKNASIWKNKVSLVHLRKAESLINIR